MFTGVIREIGRVKNFDKKFLTIEAKHKPNLGDSIAVNGACLSVIKVFKDSFMVELSDETRKIIALENYKERVHIEPAMKLGDRVEGHIIQGHIDTVGTITKIVKNQNSYDFYIEVPKEYIKFIIPKGSIAIDGVSLTINEVFKDSFRLTIIPLTMRDTLFKNYRVGRRVNIETDMFARYIYFMFKKQKSLNWEEVEKFQALF